VNVDERRRAEDIFIKPELMLLGPWCFVVTDIGFGPWNTARQSASRQAVYDPATIRLWWLGYPSRDRTGDHRGGLHAAHP